jgi:hypothetical protein
MAAPALAGALICLASAASGQNGPSGGYEVVSNGPALELRFHGVPLRAVRADDNQNALALDFNQPVDPAIFDHLSAALPGWITLAYSNYDNGVIRAARPVTFLTRPETDGFSLRLQPRDVAASGPAPGPAPLYPAPGAPQPMPAQPGYPPPAQPAYPPPPQGAPPVPQAEAQPPIPFAPYESYGAARNYYGLQYAVHRGDAAWARAYDRAAMRGDSEAGGGVEYHDFHNGDRIIASRGSFKVTLTPGLALLGSVFDTDSDTPSVRNGAGGFDLSRHDNILSGEAGIGLELGGDSQVTLQGLAGNGLVGGKLTTFAGNPNGFFSASLMYHAPYLDTPEAIANHGLKDEASASYAARLGYGLWGSVGGHVTNYGVHGDANAVQTAGWNANLRWDAQLLDGLFLGVAYDGEGEYRLRTDYAAGAAPTPYVPLSIRNRETHAGIGSVSAQIFGPLWLDGFGGYVYDRYARSGGGIYGGSIRVNPAPGLELELGVRHSNISLIQGELGGETQAGVSLSLGFGGDPRASRFALW